MRLLVIILVLSPVFLFSQEQLKGIVLETSSTKELPLSGANVYWLESSIGVDYSRRWYICFTL